jgi:hypothetical protein
MEQEKINTLSPYTDYPMAVDMLLRPASLDEISIELPTHVTTKTSVDDGDIEQIIEWLQSEHSIGADFLPRQHSGKDQILSALRLFGPFVFPYLLRAALTIGKLECNETQRGIIADLPESFDAKNLHPKDAASWPQAALEFKRAIQSIAPDLPTDTFNWNHMFLNEEDLCRFMICLYYLSMKK